MDLPEMNCAVCLFGNPTLNGRICKRYPPTVFVFFQPPTVQGGQPMPVALTQSPVVQDDNLCGEFTGHDDIDISPAD